MMRFISFIVLWLPFATAASSTFSPCSRLGCVFEASPGKLAEIELILYTGPTIDNYTSVLVGDAVDLLDLMDNNKPTVVYTFGWVADPDSASTDVVINAYLSRGDHNVLLYNWKNIASTLYDYAVRSVEPVGYTLATALNELAAHGLDTTRLKLVGHSLGAHICGYTARFTNFTVSRITGLDPAGPGFYTAAEPLKSTDAEFVEIIHTDRGRLGTNSQTGHVDFYVNNGIRSQPGCGILEISCSHTRASKYYAESLLNENSLIAVACNSYSDFKDGSCSSNPKVVMGYATPTTASGKYYLQTNSESPFGRGDEGTRNGRSENLIRSIANSLRSRITDLLFG